MPGLYMAVDSSGITVSCCHGPGVYTRPVVGMTRESAPVAGAPFFARIRKAGWPAGKHAPPLRSTDFARNAHPVLGHSRHPGHRHERLGSRTITSRCME